MASFYSNSLRCEDKLENHSVSLPFIFFVVANSVIILYYLFYTWNESPNLKSKVLRGEAYGFFLL
jgi:hypothetical protein